MKFLAVDLSSVFRRCWQASEGQDFANARGRTVQIVQRHAQGYDRIVVARDAPPSFRRLLYAGYKAKRPDPGEAFREQMKATAMDLRELGATVWASPSQGERAGQHYYGEADDVIASFALWYQEHADRDAAWHLRILSGDHDLWALVDDELGIDVMTLDGARIDAAAIVEKYSLRAPCMVSELKALSGDDSDEYDFFRGIGEGTAAAILNADIELAEGDRSAADAVFRAVLSDAAEYGCKLKSNQVAAIKAGGIDALNMGRSLAILRPLLVKRGSEHATIDFAAVLAEPVRVARRTEPAYEAPRSATEPVPATPSVAMEVHKPAPIAAARDELPFIAELDKAMTFAGEMYRSGLFRTLSSPAACLMLTEHARAFRVPAVIVGQYAYEVNGKLSFMAQLMMAVVLQHPDTIRFRFDLIKCDDKSATLLYGRRYPDGDSVRGSYVYTIEMAIAAGYTTGKNHATWLKQRPAMLRWAAARECARAIWPDATLGIRSPDEVRDGEIADGGAFPDEMTVEADDPA